jgi:hypothetical protein
MKKTIVILVCMLLLAAGVPLFAHGAGSSRGRFHNDNPHRWHGSSTHPSYHGWHGWGSAPRRCPEGRPAPDPANPPDKPGGTPVEQPGDKPGGTPVEQPGSKASVAAPRGPDRDPGPGQGVGHRTGVSRKR